MHAHKELSARVRELEERIQVWRSGRGIVLLSRRLSTNARCSQALEQRRESETSATSKAIGELRDALETEQVFLCPRVLCHSAQKSRNVSSRPDAHSPLNRSPAKSSKSAKAGSSARLKVRSRLT